MKSPIACCLMATGLGLSMNMPVAQAVIAEHSFQANAVDYCQAFTPGPTNTIRNRVVGAENVGTTAIPIACDFHTMTNGAPGSENPDQLYVFFANNNATGSTITVTCTLLTSYQGGPGYAVTKTTRSIPGGGAAQANLVFTAADNPSAKATTLGSDLVGVNCMLPPGAVVNDVYLYWAQDNGVGS